MPERLAVAVIPSTLTKGVLLVVYRYLRDTSELIEKVLPMLVTAATAVTVVPTDHYTRLRTKVLRGAVGEQGGEQVGA
ncbi:hypothetical protein ACFV4I_04290 [Nocardiopsis alba]|uniref:hypothetical protein n=1 Tax=Nocardiopsis alba TaxID=53437 RepID=UPI00365C2267